jgi:hypothetical protein
MLVPPLERLARRPRVAAACRRLSLSPQAVTLCEQARPGQAAFRVTVLEAELAHRETPRRTRWLNRAGFPLLKTLDGYDRSGVHLPSTVPGADRETGASRATARNLVLDGAVGTGKSHLATALGVRACEQGDHRPLLHRPRPRAPPPRSASGGDPGAAPAGPATSRLVGVGRVGGLAPWTGTAPNGCSGSSPTVTKPAASS